MQFSQQKSYKDFPQSFKIKNKTQPVYNQSKQIYKVTIINYIFICTKLMTENQSILNQRVKIMDNSVSFDLTLSFADVMNDLNCSKQQIARRFKLLVQQKQKFLRQEITDVNANNLKILQEKSLYFEDVNKTNKAMNDQIIKKNTQIQCLQKSVMDLQQNVEQLEEQMQRQKQKFKQFEQHTLGDYKRLQIVEKKYKKLMNQIELQKNSKNQLQRRVDKLQNDTINWGDRIHYLMQNRQKGLKQEYNQQINKLKDILFYYQQNNKLLTQQLTKEKQIFQETKQSYQFAIKNVQKKYGISNVPTFQHIKVQTEENSIKRIDVASEIKIQCSFCKQINDVARHLTRKNIHVQTMKDPKKFANNQAQTVFIFMQKKQQKLMIQQVKQTFELNQKLKEIYQKKLRQVYQILESQPSKMDDLRIIGKLQSKIAEKQRLIQLMKHDNLTLKSLNNILHSQLQAIKQQIRQTTQVRIDSIQFKKKSTTLKLFTEEFEHSEYKIHNDENQQKRLMNQKRFTKTVDLSTTRKNFKSCKTRQTTFTPDLKTKISKQKFNTTFCLTDPETSRWQKFQQKLKNPQLFSPSPYVNAVRRQKYKKYSLLKRKKNQHQHTMNFTVAF